jgi:class I fructose-bisphosphate aldolase
MEEIAALSREAKSKGLAVVIWSYPRGGDLSKEGETAVDICAYAAHMAALLGANIIKVKLPSAHLENKDAKKVYEDKKIPIGTMAERVKHVVQCCFNGKRVVIFSGGEAKSTEDLLEDVRGIAAGGGFGSIMGRNAFQRPRAESLKLLADVMDIFRKAG